MLLSLLRRGAAALLVTALSVAAWAGPQAPDTPSGSPSSAPVPSPTSGLGAPFSAVVNVNRLSLWMNSDGSTEYRSAEQLPGAVYPHGSSTVVSRGGMVWGGRVYDAAGPTTRIGGQTFLSGTVPGRIVSPGIAEHPTAPDVRVYRVRPDWETANLTRDASETYRIPEVLVTQADINRLREEYRYDWVEWPWEQGAPWYERNGVPGYQPHPEGAADPAYDEPGIAGADQVLWLAANDLDGSATTSLYGSPPIGLELQITCWAFNRADALGDVVYQRFRLFYKGRRTTPPGSLIDSMYLARWVDADIGHPADDFAGYDTTLKLMYGYNARPTDQEFDKVPAPPSAIGYALLQGPRVPSPGDEAHWNLSTLDGYRNLGPSSFTYLDDNDRQSDYRTGETAGGAEMWNILRGWRGVATGGNLQCYTDPVRSGCISFELWGDPVQFSGWVDGMTDPAGDRRIMLTSGPFALAMGDTQEVVYAVIGGAGADNRAGIVPIREATAAARDLQNLDFVPPAKVPPPPLRSVELDRTIILEWESDHDSLQAVEAYDSRGYAFEGYELVQLDSAGQGFDAGTPLPAFDILAPRFLQLTDDYIRGRPLVNGQEYFFAVRTRASSNDGVFSQRSVYSAPVVHRVVPHSPNPGTVYPYAPGEVVSDAVNIVGTNEATVRVTYFDPTRPDGGLYKLLFHRPTRQLDDLENKPTWDLIDSTTADTLLRGIVVDSPPTRVISRGFEIQVISPLFGLEGVFQTERNGQPERRPVFNLPDQDESYMFLGAGSSYLDTILGGNFQDVDNELRFLGDSSWALMLGPTAPTSRWIRVPYTAWQQGVIGTDTINRQVYTVISENGPDTVWRSTTLLDREYKGKTMRVFYPITVVTDSHVVLQGTIAGSYNDSIPWAPDGTLTRGFLWISGRIFSSNNAIWKVYIGDLDEDGHAVPVGRVIRFERYQVIRNLDEKLFSPATVVSGDVNAALDEVAKVNVFPNPYYGGNSAETEVRSHFVTFNHLPYFATIRVFNLAGDLVRTVEKMDESQFVRWDLNNSFGLPVGGGLYFAHVEMRDAAGVDLGTATLKLMIVHENQPIEVR